MTGQLITVLLPVRDEQRYITRALRSLQRQHHRNLDILVIDDGSTDRTPAIVDSMAADDQRVRRITHEGQGLAEALNAGLAAARADLVVRLDADDVMHPSRVARQLAELLRNPAAVAIGTYGIRINELGVPIGRHRTGPESPEAYVRDCERRWAFHLTHPLYRVRSAEAVGGYRQDYYPAEDYKFYNDLARIGQVYALPSPLVRITIRPRSVSGKMILRQHIQARRVEHEIGTGVTFPSSASFVEHLRSQPGLFEELEDRCRREAMPRMAARNLVNGRFLAAARILRDHHVRATDLLPLMRRVTRG